MGLKVKDIPQGGGGYFSPEKNADAVAILIEVKEFRQQVPGGTYGPKDTIYADITVFNTPAELNASTPTAELKRSAIQQKILVKDLNGEIGIGNATIVTVELAKFTNGGSGWVFRQCSQDAKAAVIAYAEKRDAATEAAIADAPSFA